jgi:hypothetical protein
VRGSGALITIGLVSGIDSCIFGRAQR